MPGVSLEDALKRVRMGVRVASLGRQLPWESTSLEEHLFIQPLSKVTSNAVDLEELEKQVDHEVTAWNLVKKIGTSQHWSIFCSSSEWQLQSAR